MMKTTLVLGAAAAALSCAAALAAAPERLPGLWQTSTTDLTGRGGGKVTTAESCIAPGDTIASTLRRQMGTNCTFSRTIVAGGRIDVAASCPSGSLAASGSYTATAMNVLIKGTLKIGPNAIPLNLSARSHRLSASCDE